MKVFSLQYVEKHKKCSFPDFLDVFRHGYSEEKGTLVGLSERLSGTCR